MTVASTAELLELPSVPGLPDTAALRPLEWQYHHPAGSEKRPAEESVTAGAYAQPRAAVKRSRAAWHVCSRGSFLSREP